MLIIALAAGLISSPLNAAPAASLPYAEVTASSGPIRITLKVLNTSVTPEDLVYFHIEVKNVGSTRLFLGSRIFLEPGHLAESSRMKIGTYLEMVTPDGGEPDRVLGDHEWVKWPTKPAPPRKPKPKAVALEPGRSTEVVCGGKRPRIHDIDWCPLGFWYLEKKGIHRIRAVYDVKPMRDISLPEAVTTHTPWVSLEVRPQ